MQRKNWVWTAALAVAMVSQQALMAQIYAPGPAGPMGYMPGPQNYGPAAAMPMMMPYPMPSMAMGVAPAMAMQPAPGPAPQAALGPIASGQCSDCLSDTCGPACNTCGTCGWCNHIGVFGEFLYLRARDADVAYAVENNNQGAAVPVQVAPIGIVDPDYDIGFRGGVSFFIDPMVSLTVAYTKYESTESDRTVRTVGSIDDVISMVTHPSTAIANSSSVFAEASQDIDFDLIDVDYRNLFACCNNFKVNYLVGARYGKLEQQFRSLFPVNGQETVATDIDFDGVGVRLGLEGETYAGCHGFMAYGKTYANFLAGEFDATYAQGSNFDASVVNTGIKVGRVVPTLDLEVGVGWHSPCDGLRRSVGYMFSAWYNMIKTDEFIDAVQRNNFVDIDGTMTFDGLVARVEGRL